MEPILLHISYPGNDETTYRELTSGFSKRTTIEELKVVNLWVFGPDTFHSRVHQLDNLIPLCVLLRTKCILYSLYKRINEMSVLARCLDFIREALVSTANAVNALWSEVCDDEQPSS